MLQFKLGAVRPTHFRDKYGVNILQRFRDQLAALVADPPFFLPQRVGIRYT